MNKFFKYFIFNTAERNGLIVLIIAVVVVNLSILLYNLVIARDSIPYELINFDTQQEVSESTISLAHHDVVSIQPAKYENEAISYFNFDPNSITAEDWKKLGLSDKKAKVVLNYISKGGRFYKKEDLKKIYSITEKDFFRLEPYITIPSSSSNSFAGEVSNAPRYEEKPTTPKIATININQIRPPSKLCTVLDQCLLCAL